MLGSGGIAPPFFKSAVDEINYQLSTPVGLPPLRWLGEPRNCGMEKPY
jgi:hypothetical protein